MLRTTCLPIAALLAGLSLQAQTTVYLRSSGPAGFDIIGATNATPVVIQTNRPHLLNPGDTVVLWGLCGPTSANGIRMVGAVPDSTHFSITELSSNPIAGNGPYCNGNLGGTPAAAKAGGKVNAFTLIAQPRGLLDGPNGTIMRKLSLGTANGLTSLVVSGNVATVTTSYNHGVSAGDQITVWNTTSPALNNSNAAYTVATVPDATHFTFTTSGVSSADYSANNACGPGGTSNCVRISQLAYTGNPWWSAMVTRAGLGIGTSGITYESVYDGGTKPWQLNYAEYVSAAAIRFLVDQANSRLLAFVTYGITNFTRIGGVNWSGSEVEATNGANNDLNDFASYDIGGIATAYEIVHDYLTSGQRQTFLDQMYNDLDDPLLTPCHKSGLVTRRAIVTGAAQGGTSNTIVLNASDSAADNFYVNNIVTTTISGAQRNGLITAYVASTKTATISGTWTLNPSSGTAYSIYESVTLSGTAITGYNTHFTSELSVGDAIIGLNAWNNAPLESQSYVSAINSDTSLTVINSTGPTANATPQSAWFAAQWRTGDCGLMSWQKHWEGSGGSQPIMYPVDGGDQTLQANGDPAWASNNGGTFKANHILMDLAAADDDPRAIKDLAIAQQQWFDYNYRYGLNYSTGFFSTGSYYSFARPIQDQVLATAAITNSVASYPSLDPTGPWINEVPLMKIYTIQPEKRTNWWPARWGAQNGDNELASGGIVASGFVTDGGFLFNPASMNSQYLKNWLVTNGFWVSGAILDTSTTRALLWIDPRSPASNYTVQPTQYYFGKTDVALCNSLTGWVCPASFRADVIVSRTGWSSQSDTLLWLQARSYWSDHDYPSGGALRIYKTGHLLSNDAVPHGSGVETDDPTKIGDLIEFNGTRTIQPGGGNTGVGVAATANIIRWASANSGTWAANYGDASSRYAYATADLSGMYTTAYNHVWRHLIHFKKPGTEEIVIQFDDVDASNAPTQIRTQVQYAQNGEVSNDGMPEGQTTCPGPNGCPGLNIDRLMLSQENGSTSSSGVVRNYGLISNFFSPGSIFVRDDGSTYTGAAGHTHRVSICAGSSCGSTVSSLEAVIVHKIAPISDVNLTAKALNPDGKWTGVQTTDKVALFSRKAVLSITADFSTDHAGTAQYLVAGLRDGLTYRVFRPAASQRGTLALAHPVTGTDVAQLNVQAGDNSLYFEATSGNYLIFPTGLSKLILGDANTPQFQVGVPCLYDFKVAGDPAVYVWSVSGGNLPGGMALAANGVLSGTPTSPGAYTANVTVQTLGSSATYNVTIQVASKPVLILVTAATPVKAIVEYGMLGLDASQKCTLMVGTTADFTTILEQQTDGGGAAQRVFVAGNSASLIPGTTYYFNTNCGASVGTAQFQTAPAAPSVPRSVLVSATIPPQWNSTSLQIQYGSTPSLGSILATPCSGACQLQVPAMTGTIMYLKRLFLDASASVVAQSSVQPIAVN